MLDKTEFGVLGKTEVGVSEELSFEGVDLVFPEDLPVFSSLYS